MATSRAVWRELQHRMPQASSSSHAPGKCLQPSAELLRKAVASTDLPYFKQLFEKFGAEKVVPDDAVRKAVLEAFSKVGNRIGGHKLIVRALSKAADPETTVHWLLREMPESRVLPDAGCYRLGLAACLQSGTFCCGKFISCSFCIFAFLSTAANNFVHASGSEERPEVCIGDHPSDAILGLAVRRC